jgi:hypothetical protein
MPRAKAPSNPLARRTASVILERNGACIRVDDVPGTQAAVVLAQLLTDFRALQRRFPELIVDLGSVCGGPTVDVPEEYEDAEQRRRVGF